MISMVRPIVCKPLVIIMEEIEHFRSKSELCRAGHALPRLSTSGTLARTVLLVKSLDAVGVEHDSEPKVCNSL